MHEVDGASLGRLRSCWMGAMVYPASVSLIGRRRGRPKGSWSEKIDFLRDRQFLNLDEKKI